ncbi:hypothetical protein ACSBR1_004969 [Camellia fascicularis]
MPIRIEWSTFVKNNGEFCMIRLKLCIDEFEGKKGFLNLVCFYVTKTFCFKIFVCLFVQKLQILAPLPIGFAVFLVILATIPITGTGINPARSLGAAIIYNKDHAWDDRWVFWVPFIGAALAALYYQIVIKAIPFKSRA